MDSKMAIREALDYYMTLQEWITGSLHATDAEKELAYYRLSAARVAMNELKISMLQG